MLNQKFTTVKHVKKKNLLGITDSMSNKPYVIGFPKHQMAQKLCSLLPADPSIIVQRMSNDNLTLDFNESLSDVGLEHFRVDKLTVDYGAKLVIPKRTIGESMTDYMVHNIESSDFLLYPFEKSIGIIIPQDYIRETKTNITYFAMIIDPCFNANLFMKGLSDIRNTKDDE